MDRSRDHAIVTATRSPCFHLDRVHYSQQSLHRVQVRWLVRQQKDTQPDVSPALFVHLSIIHRHSNDSDVREWMFRTPGRVNVGDCYDLPGHLLHPGHWYEISVKLASCDGDCSNELMRVLDTETISFRLGT